MDHGIVFLTFGALLAASLALDALGRFTRLPRITMLVLFGLAIGPSGLDILDAGFEAWRDPVAAVALTMIAFLLGGAFHRRELRAHGRAILSLSVAVTVMSLLIVFLALLAIGVPADLAAVLAAIGLATDPAATRDVIVETRAEGEATSAILGVVAIDDAWGVVVFSIVLGIVAAGGAGLWGGIGEGLLELGGAVAVGVALGLPAAYLTGRIKPGEPTLIEALGLVMLCAGLSKTLGVSFLLAGMVMGALVVNLARHHKRPFHEIELISGPFLILFFVLAGALVDLAALWAIGGIGIAYLAARTAGRVLGGWAGAGPAGMTAREGLLVGICLTPQAGVALGMALVAAAALPDYAATIMTLTVASTIFFELLGPIAARIALGALGETKRARETAT